MAAEEIEKHHVQSLDVVRELLPWRQKLATTFGTGHANADLQLIDMLIVMLAGFFNPLVRTQRMVDALSGQKWMKELTEVERIPRSTLSDALTRFDSEQLRPLIHDLVNRVPALARRDADLAGITRQIVAADGSYFTTGCNVAWAMLGNSRPGKKHDQVRWNLQLEVDRFIPIDCDISGKNDISEPAAFIRNLHSQVIYVADRNFFSYAFINAVFEKDSSLVLRLRKDPKFDPSQAQPLCETDIQTGVISDDLGHFHGAADKSSQHYKSFTDKPPVQLLRRVVVWDEKNQKQIILVTDLLDVPAHVIADIYRRRWQTCPEPVEGSNCFSSGSKPTPASTI